MVRAVKCKVEKRKWTEMTLLGKVTTGKFLDFVQSLLRIGTRIYPLGVWTKKRIKLYTHIYICIYI